ncbi:hypothetical protein LRS71_05935 [Rhodococcus pyridinivorans]|uniref:hypothetical protein n=1 Tax=Rhodococcus pyridinivorans TaxID=103816 RepID=UPI001E61D524|nr:hypothetical protein [Rhodococcus pyridinivorans]MCD5419101.1 hypothetical protein [Rhodococcus pyridinivorans]
MTKKTKVHYVPLPADMWIVDMDKGESRIENVYPATALKIVEAGGYEDVFALDDSGNTWELTEGVRAVAPGSTFHRKDDGNLHFELSREWEQRRWPRDS